MVSKMTHFWGIVAVSTVAIYAQITNQATTGIPAPQLSGTGVPSTNFTCNVQNANLTYIQLDATTGRTWICDFATGSWAWDHLVSPITAVTGGSLVSVGSLLAGGCGSIVTVTVSGAVVGTNSATVSPVFQSAPSGNIGLLNVVAWVSAANTVSVQACSIGILSSVPSFFPRILLY